MKNSPLAATPVDLEKALADPSQPA